MLPLIRPSLLCLLLAVVVAVPAPKNAPDTTLTGLSRRLDIPSAAKHAKLSLPFTKLAYVAGNTKANFGGAKDLRRILSLSFLKKQHGKLLSEIQTASRNKIAKNVSPASATSSLKTLSAEKKALDAQSLYQTNRGKSDIVQHLMQSKTVPFQHSLRWKSVLDVSRAVSERDGLAGEPCTSASDCQGERSCNDSQGEACSSGSLCFCGAISLCTSSSDCVTAGEVCVDFDDAESSVCFSESVAVENDIPIVDGGPGSQDGSEGSGGAGSEGDDESEDGDSDSTGLTVCTSDTACQGEKECLDATTQDPCESGSSCFCLQKCGTTSDCETTGEVCLFGPAALICVPESVAEQNGNVIVNEDPALDGDGDGTGLTGDSCRFGSDCMEGRLCFDGSIKNLCEGGSSCRCVAIKLQTCSTSSDCETAGEVCVQGQDALVCVSESAADADELPIVDDGDESGGEGGDGSGDGSENEGEDESEDESEVESDDGSGEEVADESEAESEVESDDGSGEEVADENEEESEGEDGEGNGEGTQNDDGINTSEDAEVCIDARALEGISSKDLVFKKHAIGRVLCDSDGSCATSGHMVTFHGRAMRMRTYCDAVGCTAATMAVNSARYNRGLRIRSKTEGLEYTAFAARYDTRAEEMVIRMAVGLGL